MAKPLQKLTNQIIARGKTPEVFLAGVTGLVVLALITALVLLTGVGITPPSNPEDGGSTTIYRGRIGSYNLVVNCSPQQPTPGQSVQLELVFPDNPQPQNFNITITPDMTGMPMPGAVDIKAIPETNSANVYVATIPISMEGLWIYRVTLQNPASVSATPLTVTFNDTVGKPAPPWLLVGLGIALVTLALALVIYFFWNSDKDDPDEDEDVEGKEKKEMNSPVIL
ncbi:MAG: hypothetical protein J0I20_00380 [Chloroflexi bacterium]|nr:hypothetical protein [Chloroflexota bacterium]OJW02612.1 MAG: hypothetical protein BGO39_08695 [Chloroflexi bacterium 54-19]